MNLVLQNAIAKILVTKQKQKIQMGQKIRTIGKGNYYKTILIKLNPEII